MGNSEVSDQVRSHRKYSKKQKFEDRYQRMTVYIENQLFERLQYQREQGYITNVTDFVNKAITAYIDKA